MFIATSDKYSYLGYKDGLFMFSHGQGVVGYPNVKFINVNNNDVIFMKEPTIPGESPVIEYSYATSVRIQEGESDGTSLISSHPKLTLLNK